MITGAVTIRTKIWLLVALSVSLTVAAASWLRAYITRQKLETQAQESATELARDVVDDLERLEADADDRELAEKLDGYLRRHARIQRIDLYVERESSISSSRIVAGRERLEITRLGAFHREPHQMVTRRNEGGGEMPAIELPVDLKGPWKGTLVMKWTLGPVETVLKTEQRYSLVFGAGLLVALVLVAGLVTDRVVGRPLDALARAMRDVEAGDLARRVAVRSQDEVGRLARGFNSMLERLGDANAEIRAFNERLAGEIEAATRDLSEKNAQLGQVNRLLDDMRRENASRVRLATLGQLAAQLAHEIGTPLASISGHLQLALVERNLAPGLRDRLDVSTRELERISRIVRDYLDSTRPLDPERKLTPLGRLLEDAVEIARGVEPTRRPLVACRVDPAVGEIVTDPGLLRQIVVNLVTNALDAVERGGEASVEARPAGTDVQISVRDTGAGIGPEDLRRIFEPFYTTKGRGKGTGLGLAICRQLASALGGDIIVDSAPGAGSTFTVRLPRAGAPQTERNTPTPLRVVQGGRA